MIRLALLFSLLFLSSASARQIEEATEPIFISQETELHQVSSSMTAVEQKVRGAAVKIINKEALNQEILGIFFYSNSVSDLAEKNKSSI